MYIYICVVRIYVYVIYTYWWSFIVCWSSRKSPADRVGEAIIYIYRGFIPSFLSLYSLLEYAFIYIYVYVYIVSLHRFTLGVLVAYITVDCRQPIPRVGILYQVKHYTNSFIYFLHSLSFFFFFYFTLRNSTIDKSREM